MTKKKKKKAKKTTKKLPKPKPEKQEPVDVTAPPTAGRKVVDFERKLDDQIAGGPPEPEKRGRGRPMKEAEPEPSATIDNKIIKDAVCVPFDLWARSQKLNGLRITDEEAQSLSEPIKTLLDYYLPEVPAIAFAWGSLAITAYAITSPRLFMIEDERKVRKAKTESIRNADQAGTETRPGQSQGRPDGPRDRFPRNDEITPLKIQN